MSPSVIVGFPQKPRLNDEIPAKKEEAPEEVGWSQVEKVIVRGEPKDQV